MLFFNLFNSTELPARTGNSYKQFDSDDYEKATKNVDYSEDIEEREYRAPKNAKPISLGNWSILGDLFKGLAIIIVVGGLAYLVFLLFDENYGNRKILDSKSLQILDNLEQHIHEVDLSDLLKQAIENGDFKLAVRIHYLIIIKGLSNSKIIAWKKQKTNGEYLSELFGKPIFEEFRKATNLFERVWYGDVQIDESKYLSVKMHFEQLLGKIPNKVGNETK